MSDHTPGWRLSSLFLLVSLIEVSLLWYGVIGHTLDIFLRALKPQYTLNFPHNLFLKHLICTLQIKKNETYIEHFVLLCLLSFIKRLNFLTLQHDIKLQLFEILVILLGHLSQHRLIDPALVLLFLLFIRALHNFY